MCDCTEESGVSIQSGKKKKSSHPTLSFIKKKLVIKGRTVTVFKPESE